MVIDLVTETFGNVVETIMMTNEQAIKLLHRISDSQFDGKYGDERREALEMAVRALDGDGDLISRKQVLNASHFVACWDGVEHFSLEVVDADFIQKLPSVQPTQTNAQPTQFNALDCVSRRAAIDAIKEDKIDLTNPNVVAVFKATGNFEKAETQVMTCDRHIKILKNLPSAQPQRKKGKWIPSYSNYRLQSDNWYRCDQCRNESQYPTNFCPSCGADMRGENDG